MMVAKVDRPTESYLGGLRWIGGNATWPLVRLQLESEGMRIIPSFGLLGAVLPQWHFPWSDVIRAERVQGVLFASSGVRFYIRDRQYPFTFWYTKPARVLDALARRGIPVDNDKHRVGLLGL
jgi:hypothetical protein